MDPIRPLTADTLDAFVRTLLEAGLGAVAPAACVERALRDAGARSWFGRRSDPRPLDVVAVGKAAEGMCRALLRAGPSGGVERALVVCPGGDADAAGEGAAAAPGIPVERLPAEHPLPGPRGSAAARRVEQWVCEGAGRDLVVLLSGGASSLLPAPAEGFSLDDKILWSDRLMRAGADIEELNAVRIQMSRTKGGRLAARSRYARTLVLVISDVVGDDLAVVGSGPWFPSRSSGRRAAEILRGRLGPAAEDFARRLERAPDPPPAEHPGFERVLHVLGGSGATAHEAMGARAASWFLDRGGDGAGRCASWGTRVVGEAREVARRLAREVRAQRTGLDDGMDAASTAVWIGAGETTVTVRGAGLGGRNQELALAFALEWERGGARSGNLEPSPFVFASLGSDGRDGPTPAAGALVDHRTLERMRAAGIDPEAALDCNDSHGALASVGATLVTGPTGTNVGDLMVCVVPATI